MQIFDQIDIPNLDRREAHLWVLSFALIFILLAGMALLMYPTAFSSPVVLTASTFRKVFIGFCALAVLLLGYLIDRKLEISHLRQQLAEEQRKVTQVQHEARADLLGTIPGFEHFQDRLTMEHRRASSTRKPLSLLVVAIHPSPNLLSPAEISSVVGDAAKVLMRKLRGEDSIYLLSRGAFCALLPGVDAKCAHVIATRLAEGLHDAAGVRGRFTFEVRVVNYPDDVETAREIEDEVRPLIPELVEAPPQREAGVASTRIR